MFDVVSVPGALEVPTAIALAEEAGRFPTAPRYDGYVALGCVIRGETYHFEIVSDQSASKRWFENSVMTVSTPSPASSIWYRA